MQPSIASGASGEKAKIENFVIPLIYCFAINN
jgi:hypothetical protein